MPAVQPLRPDTKFVPVQPTSRRRSIDTVIEVVARSAGMSPWMLCRGVRSHARSNARSAVAVLAMEFSPLTSELGCDRAMDSADEGLTRYYRQRHAERCALFPCYRQLYIKARIALMAGSAQ